MYSAVKDALLKIIPKEILFKNEFLLRKIYSLLYSGTAVYCNICDKHFSRFLKIHIDDMMCPRCGSLARHRRLWQIINNDFRIQKNDRILDFSPSRIIMEKLKRKFPNYLSSNFLENQLVDRTYDITAIIEPSGSFNWIICYHILEHVEDDFKAFGELFRVIKKGGCVFIQTPFKEGEISENPAIITKKDRLIYFGQEDHVRIYSVNGLKDRLQAAGFKVKILEFNEDINNKYGFKPKEVIIIAEK